MVYHCYGGAHSSVAAAALHAGIIRPEAGVGDIARIPGFDLQPHSEHARLRFYAQAVSGEEIYILARRNRPEVADRLLKELAGLMGCAPQMFVTCSASSCTNLLTVAGGILSRRLGMVKLGRIIAAWGIKISLRCIWELVRGVREALEVLKNSGPETIPHKKPDLVIFCSQGGLTPAFWAARRLIKGYAPPEEEFRKAHRAQRCLVYLGCDPRGWAVYACSLRLRGWMVGRLAESLAFYLGAANIEVVEVTGPGAWLAGMGAGRLGERVEFIRWSLKLTRERIQAIMASSGGIDNGTE